MKSVSKNKFLTCFRPVVDFDTNVAYPSTNRCKHDRASSSMFSDGSGSRLIETHVVDHPPKQTLAKNTKAHKKKRYSQSCFGSKRNYSLHTRTSSSSFKTNIEEKAIESSLSSSSSSLCSPVSESKTLSKSSGYKLHKTQKFQCLGIYMMILISLVVTLSCGKINVIILTLMLFSCFCCWNRSSNWLKRVGISCQTQHP
ncbi:uncharacterized protein LOC127083365 isoform X2 [Lathyrus oleraceus]|uniref:Uncharacterized protein n=1 Tax=Pisum sativum TaxID=3888 RepID=A0A9D4X368_PEA|nr:uncharacterized protein LOC127083365 isoform X2 [Pisum sativum]KAI5412803.1 hypothetical protein KIW84_057432 [Pisum sativum]